MQIIYFNQQLPPLEVLRRTVSQVTERRLNKILLRQIGIVKVIVLLYKSLQKNPLKLTNLSTLRGLFKVI